MESLSGDELFDRRHFAIYTHVEVENFLPHRRDVDEMALLAEVLLRDLNFHGLAGVLHTTKERGHRLACLEVDRAFFGLNNDIGREFAVEWMEDVIGGAGAISLGIGPIEVVVVDECSVEDDTAVRSQSGCERIRGIGGRAAVARGASLALGIRYNSATAKV